MTQPLNQIEKQTIVARMSVSIYKMETDQLVTILKLLENEPSSGDDSDDKRYLPPGPENMDFHREMIIARLFVLINQLDKDNLLQRLRLFQHPHFKWIREYPRLKCYIIVDFASGGKAYRSCIRDISAGGVFIETGDNFQEGQEISLCFSLSEADEVLPFKINGKVMRTHHDGIGVEYENVTEYQRDIISALIDRL
ncbi:MAG: PilZ domain-containing protein [Desulfobacteraceae bacterium]|jgi:Tfp pilus assembly protein PilZ